MAPLKRRERTAACVDKRRSDSPSTFVLRLSRPSRRTIAKVSEGRRTKDQGRRTKDEGRRTTLSNLQERCEIFHRLHESGCFVIPNPWNAGSARLLAQFGFKALATTSSGFAWSLGQIDGGVSRDRVLDHLREMSAAVSIPISADF